MNQPFRILLIGTALVAAFLMAGGCQTSKIPDRAELQAHMDRYIALFNAGDAEAIAKNIYAAPVLFPMPGTDQHFVKESMVEVQRHWADTFAGIRSKGWKRSLVHDLDFRMAGPDMAVASMTFSRLRANGEPIPPARRIAHYLLLKTDAGWRIILVCSQAETDKQAPPQAAADLQDLMGQYIGYLNGDQPAAEVSNQIWQTPRISRSFMGARTHSAKLSKELAYERLDGYLKQLKAEGLDRFVVKDLKVHMASKNLAFVDLVSSRLKDDGTPIPPADTPFTYVWVKKSYGWKMICTLAHGKSEKTVSINDFKDYCAANIGKWTGDVTSVASETSTGKKGDGKLTYNFEVRMAHGGKAMIREVTGPNSASTAMIYYDVATKKIRTLYASSTGAISHYIIHREGDRWIRHKEQTAPDGSKSKSSAMMTFSNNGNTKTIEMSSQRSDGTIWRQTNVWHRIEK